MNDKEFEERWNRAAKLSQERLRSDKSLELLVKKRDDYAKRLGKIEGEILRHQQKVFYEELKRQITTK